MGKQEDLQDRGELLTPLERGALLNVQEINFQNSGQINKQIHSYFGNYISENPGVKPVLDLSNVEEMDSSGVAGLVKLSSLAKRKGTDIKLRGLKNKAKGTLDISRLQGLFEMSDSSDSCSDLN